MNTSPQRDAIAFSGTERVAAGTLADVAVAVARSLRRDPHQAVIVLDAETSEPIELDLRGTDADVLARLGVDAAAPATPRSPGRPKLGVVAREVTLLPRHWEWLAAQPGGASVTLRKLVEAARRDGADEQRVREARDALYRFMFAVAGDEPGFETASRCLYAGDREGFSAIVAAWPVGVRDHATRLAAAAFPMAVS